MAQHGGVRVKGGGYPLGHTFSGPDAHACPDESQSGDGMRPYKNARSRNDDKTINQGPDCKPVPLGCLRPVVGNLAA